MTYTIKHNNGRKDPGYETLDDALAHARDYYRDLLGHHVDYEQTDTGVVLRDPEDSADYAFLAQIFEAAS
jgi:hypothetical protein